MLNRVARDRVNHHFARKPRASSLQPEDTRLRHGIAAFPIRQVVQSRVDPEAPTKGEHRTDSSDGPGARIQASLKKIPLLYSCLKGIRDGFGFLRGIWREVGFLAQSYRNLKGTELLMIAGSGQLTDQSGGSWAYPYTFFKWSFLARATGTKLAFMSIGTGWIDSPLSKFFFRSALSRADYLSFRGEDFRKQVGEWGLRGESIVVPDLAYSFHMPNIAAQPKSSHSSPVVGINPVPFFHETMWHKADKQIYDQYVQTQSSFASWLIRRGYTVLFFPTQLRADPPVIQDIVQALERNHPGLSGYQTVDPPMRSHEDLISVMSGMDIVVAARFHGVLISHLLHKPVLAVSYHAKTADLMAQMGQSQCVLHIDACSLDALTSRFLFLESQSKAIAAELERRVPSCRAALDSQYERVFGLLEQGVVRAQTPNKSKAWPKEPSNARIDYGS